MNNIGKYLELIAYCIIFMISVVTSMGLKSNYQNLFQQQKVDLYNNVQNLMYDKFNDRVDVISSSELIVTLMYELDYDIQIDNILISKIDNNASFIGQWNSYNGLYEKSYVYDRDGRITRIIYRSMDEI